MPGQPSSIHPMYDHHGQLIGTRIHHGAKVFELPHYPKRIKAIVPRPGGGLVVHFERGHAKLLEPQDARGR